jgi:hypothetical protein
MSDRFFRPVAFWFVLSAVPDVDFFTCRSFHDPAPRDDDPHDLYQLVSKGRRCTVPCCTATTSNKVVTLHVSLLALALIMLTISAMRSALLHETCQGPYDSRRQMYSDIRQRRDEAVVEPLSIGVLVALMLGAPMELFSVFKRSCPAKIKARSAERMVDFAFPTAAVVNLRLSSFAMYWCGDVLIDCPIPMSSGKACSQNDFEWNINDVPHTRSRPVLKRFEERWTSWWTRGESKET